MPALLLRLAAACDRISRAMGAVTMACVLAMVLLQFGLVVLRYVFGMSWIFLQEGVLYLHAAIFMLGAGYTLWAQGHVRVDIFHSRLSPRGQAGVDVLGHLLFLGPALGMLLYWSWPMVRRSWAILEGPISTGGIPASFLLKSLVPAFCVLVLVQGLAALIRDAVRLAGADHAA